MMEGLENVFSAVWIMSNPSKDLIGSRNATCVGIDFVEGTKLMPQVSKLWDCLLASRDIIVHPHSFPLEVASYCGTTQWFDLLNRWLFSCLDHVYAFNRANGPSVSRELPSEVLSELLLNLVLSPFWLVDFCRPWHDQLVT